jgi:hypothetical protein
VLRGSILLQHPYELFKLFTAMSKIAILVGAGEAGRKQNRITWF